MRLAAIHSRCPTSRRDKECTFPSPLKPDSPAPDLNNLPSRHHWPKTPAEAVVSSSSPEILIFGCGGEILPSSSLGVQTFTDVA